VEADEWRALAIIVVAVGVFLDFLIAPWLVVFDALLFLAAGIVYLIVRRRRDSRGA